MRYSYYCVPTPIGSLAELSGQTDHPVTAEEVNRQRRLLGELPADGLPAVWGIHRVVCEA